MATAASRLRGLKAAVSRINRSQSRALPEGCRSLQEWMARLRKHRAMVRGMEPSPELWMRLDALPPLFLGGSEEPLKWALEITNNRIATKLEELKARDWSKAHVSNLETLPAASQEVVKPERPKRPAPMPKVDRLAAYRDQRDVIIPEPEAEC